MTSTATNDNSTSPSQTAQFSFSGPKVGATSSLASLANATEPSSFSLNPQQTSVATFPQRTIGGSSTANTGSPLGVSFSQATTSESTPSFSFTQSSSTNAPAPFPNLPTENDPRFSFANLSLGNPPAFTFNQSTDAPVPSVPNLPTGNVPRFPAANLPTGNPPAFRFNQPTDAPASSVPNLPTENVPRFSFPNLSLGNPPAFTFNQSTDAPAPSVPNLPTGNVPRFSFTNLPTGNPPAFTFNQPTANSQVRQPLPSFTITSSTQKQEVSNDESQFSAPSTLTLMNNPQEIPTTNEATRSSSNNTIKFSKKSSDPPTPVSQQPSLLSQDQEESDAPTSLEEDSLVAKKVNTKLRDSNAFVVDRSDPNSPLFSLKSFQELNLKPELLKGIYNMGFNLPSKIQEIALPHLLNNPPRNIIAQSQSGTGKTAAFSLAILSRINPSISSTQALILAPTFELALQIGSVIEKMAQFLPYIQIAYAVRDPSISKKANLVRGQLLTESIVIGTPATVEEWCRKRRVIDLSKLRMCCVDEADVMIDTQGFQQICVELVRSLSSSNCQMMLFSATYSDEVMAFAREIVQNPVVLRLKREKQALNNIRQFYIRCYDPEQKYYAIQQIYVHLTIGQAMIFCRTKATARELAIRMANDNHSVRELTGALDIEQRASVISGFREGLFRVLISTNVTSRGIDIDDVSLVINYDMPVTIQYEPDYETYLHRIGRCGRFGKLGYTFNLINSEKDFNIMKSIEQYFSHPIAEITIEDISHLEQDQE